MISLICIIVKGFDEPIGNVDAQKRIARLDKDAARGIVMEAYPWGKYINWTIRDFGPLHVPARGQTVAMDSTQKIPATGACFPNLI